MMVKSKTGVLETDPANVEYSGRLEPGKIFMLDLEQGRIIPDEEVKKELFEEYEGVIIALVCAILAVSLIFYIFIGENALVKPIVDTVMKGLVIN